MRRANKYVGNINPTFRVQCLRFHADEEFEPVFLCKKYKKLCTYRLIKMSKALN